MDDERLAPSGGAAPSWIRPQTLLLNFCGNWLLGRPEAVFSGSLVDVLRRVNVGEYAARATLARMTRRDLLETHRLGKRSYLALTARGRAVLEEGGRALEAGPVNRSWDGRWTLLGFSLPETRRADRHLLRSRLTWAGFGLLQHGLWISSAEVDVERLLEGLDVVDHLNVLRATTAGPTEVGELIRRTWDLDALAGGYRAFLDRWDRRDPLPGAGDDLSRLLQLMTEWLLLVRDDPRLPLEHLPADWPAVRAEQVEVRLRRRYEEPAKRVVEEIIDRIPLPAAQGLSR